MSIHGFFQTVPLEGTALALLGAALAVGLPCAGSATGVGTVGRAGAGLLSVDPGKFSRVLVMQILPGTQGLYGLVIWFFALTKLGFFSGELAHLTPFQGLEFFGACLPVALGGLIFGIVQGRICAGGLSLIAKKPNDLSRVGYSGHYDGVLRDSGPAGIVFNAQPLSILRRESVPLLTGTGGIIHGDNWNCIGVCRRGPGSGLGLLGVCPRGGQCRRSGGRCAGQRPGKFSQILILQIIPGTQGLYGLVAWFLP